MTAALVAVAGLSIIVWRGHKVALSLREDNRQLQGRVAQLEQSTRDIAAPTPEPDPAITSDLMKLRAEVAELRRHTNEIQKLQGENAQLKSALVAAQSTPAAPEVKPLSTNGARPALFFPRDTWIFSGFASPEDTLKSAAWAMSNGDPNSFLASLSPGQREQMERRWQGKSQEEIAAESRREMEKNYDQFLSTLGVYDPKMPEQDRLVLAMAIGNLAGNDLEILRGENIRQAADKRFQSRAFGNPLS